MDVVRCAGVTALIATLLPAQDGLVWHQDLAAAQKLAGQQDKPLLLLFRCER